MLLANTELYKKNIVRVYDSDKKKQGMIFAGIEIHSFNEKDIIDGNIDTILIATYTAQIAISKLLDKYKSDINIITLYDSVCWV